MTTFYFIRHGQMNSAEAYTKIYQGWGFNALTLSQAGIDQIRKAAVESYEKGGAEVSFEYETSQKAQTKTNPEKSGKEDARQGKPSVLKNLSEEKKASRTSKPVTVSAAEKKAVGAER